MLDPVTMLVHMKTHALEEAKEAAATDKWSEFDPGASCMHEELDLGLFEEQFNEILDFSNMHLADQYDAADDSLLKVI